MNLQSVIDKKKEAAEYMVSEITHICKDFEKRDPGSKGEQQACEYMADVLKNECGCERADVESFKENPGSFFGWIYFTITFVLAAVAISFFYPLVSIILIVVGLLIVFMQFGLYKKFIDRFFPERPDIMSPQSRAARAKSSAAYSSTVIRMPPGSGLSTISSAVSALRVTRLSAASALYIILSFP